VSRRGAPGPPDGREPRLAEFPLGSAAAAPPARDALRSAPMSLRAMAATADLAAVMLGISLPIVSAAAIAGRWPTPRGLAWSVLFAVTFSFGSTVAALFLFGRTPGMTLAGLALRADATGRHPTFGQAAARWLGTALCAATLGLPLLLGGEERSTPADRFSGRPLVEEE